MLTSVQLTALLLMGGGLLALLAGGALLNRAGRQARHSYVRLRRQTILRAWRYLLWGFGLLSAAGLVFSFGEGVLHAVNGGAPSVTLETPAAGVTAPPAVTPASASAVTATPPPPATASPTSGPTVTPNLTPVLPQAQITPPKGTLTVTPPAAAVVANLRVSRLNDCASPNGAAENFTTAPKPLYALFDYDSWLPGMTWTSVWRRAGEVVHTETLLWDGSTGGCGFANFDNAGRPWAEGAYTVQIFVGDTWLGTAAFTIFDKTPPPTATP